MEREKERKGGREGRKEGKERKETLNKGNLLNSLFRKKKPTYFLSCTRVSMRQISEEINENF